MNGGICYATNHSPSDTNTSSRATNSSSSSSNSSGGSTPTMSQQQRQRQQQQQHDNNATTIQIRSHDVDAVQALDALFDAVLSNKHHVLQQQQQKPWRERNLPKSFFSYSKQSLPQQLDAKPPMSPKKLLNNNNNNNSSSAVLTPQSPVAAASAVINNTAATPNNFPLSAEPTQTQPPATPLLLMQKRLKTCNSNRHSRTHSSPATLEETLNSITRQQPPPVVVGGPISPSTSRPPASSSTSPSSIKMRINDVVRSEPSECPDELSSMRIASSS